jgi:acetylornithine deacetylase/succinyl-diaminopimelate desuccinylase-like protein
MSDTGRACEWTQRHDELFGRACATITRHDLVELLSWMVRTPSPTGGEEALSRLLTAYLDQEGIAAEYQSVTSGRGNAVGRRTGGGSGAALLLYAPIDTHGSVASGDLRPGFTTITPDLALEPTVVGSHVIGLGAENPKAFAACVVGAMVAIARADTPLIGDVWAGLVAGGMPDLGEPAGAAETVGLGFGGEALLRRVRPDYALIAKGGWVVSAEEPGLCWIRVSVRGLPGYAGTRHLAPYRNAIVDAARVTLHLESWFGGYSSRHATPSITPQGSIGAVRAGWPHKPAFVSGQCELFVDLRLASGQSARSAHRELEAALDELRGQDNDLDVTSELIAALPAEETPRDAWIIRSSERAWEAIEGRVHQPRTGASGVTDALVLRRWGIPTAKVGLERDPSRPPGYDRFTLGVASLNSMEKLVRLIIRVIIDTCCRVGDDLA